MIINSLFKSEEIYAIEVGSIYGANGWEEVADDVLLTADMCDICNVVVASIENLS